MASYTVNSAAVDHATRLIKAHHYVLDSDWGEAQPKAGDENSYPRSTPGTTMAPGTWG